MTNVTEYNAAPDASSFREIDAAELGEIISTIGSLGHTATTEWSRDAWETDIGAATRAAELMDAFIHRVFVAQDEDGYYFATEAPARFGLEVVFDNGGGVTVQCNAFAHNYDDATQAADDVKKLLAGDDPADWDGNDDACRINYDHDDLGSGGLKVYDVSDLNRETADTTNTIRTGWANADDFLAAFTGREVEA